MKLKKLTSILAAICLGGALLAGCGASTQKTQTPEQTSAQETTEKETSQSALSESTLAQESETQAEEENLLSGRHHVVINVKDYGSISVELYADEAPITVTNFVKLAKEGFYDGLTFHRIMEGFMMQGGDPLGTGMGGSDQTIKGEFASNGVENPLTHTRGAISMARSQNPDSASSQFFIVHEDSTFLDGDYAVFGYSLELLALG